MVRLPWFQLLPVSTVCGTTLPGSQEIQGPAWWRPFPLYALRCRAFVRQHTCTQDHRRHPMGMLKMRLEGSSPVRSAPRLTVPMFFFMSLGCKLNHSVKSGSPKLCLWSNLHVQVLQSAPLSVWSLFGCHRSLCGSRCKLHICLGTERCKKDKTASYLAGEQIEWCLACNFSLLGSMHTHNFMGSDRYIRRSRKGWKRFKSKRYKSFNLLLLPRLSALSSAHTSLTLIETSEMSHVSRCSWR